MAFEAQCESTELKVFDVTDDFEELREKQISKQPATRMRKRSRMQGCFEQIPFQDLLDFGCRKTIDIILTEKHPQPHTTRCGVKACQELAQFVTCKAGLEYNEENEIFVCFEYKKKSMTTENKTSWIFCINSTVLLERKDSKFCEEVPEASPQDDDSFDMLEAQPFGEPPAKQPRQETMIVYSILAWLKFEKTTNQFFMVTDQENLGGLFDRGSEEVVRYEKAQKDWMCNFPNLHFVNVCFSFPFS